MAMPGAGVSMPLWRCGDPVACAVFPPHSMSGSGDEGLGLVRRDGLGDGLGLDLRGCLTVASECHLPFAVLASARLGFHVRRTRGCHGRLIYRTPL